MRTFFGNKTAKILCLFLSCCVFFSSVGVLTASALVRPKDSGYAAVGHVDLTENTATVLFDDGTQGTVSFTGTAPLPGAVYRYVQSGMTYAFSVPSLNWGESHQLSGSFSANRPGVSGWQMTMWSWGGFSDSGWSGNLFRLSADAVVFIRYSETEWRVLTRSQIAPLEGGVVTGYFSYAYNGSDFVSDLIVLGDYQDGTGIIPPSASELAVFGPGLETGNADLSSPFKTVIASGYAAVGKVDASAGKAQVLLQTGVTGTVRFVGTPPVSGAVSLYNAYSDGTYEFEKPQVNFGNSDQNVDGTQWYFGAASWNGFWDAAPNFYIPAAGTPIFIRYSASEWRLIPFAHGMFAQDHYPVPGYMIVGRNTGDSYYVLNAFVVGKHENGAPVAPSAEELQPFGGSAVSSGDVDLGEFAEEPPQIVETGYAAVGKVDAGEKKARVLFNDGSVATVTYSGQDPVSGAVHRYAIYNDDSLHFSIAVTNHGYGGNQLDLGSAWTFNGFVGGGNAYIQDSTPWTYRFTDDMPIFIRYGRYQWRVLRGKDAIKQDSATILYGYAEVISAVSDTEFLLGTFVLGNFADGEPTPPRPEETKVFDPQGKGWEQGNKDIGEFFDVIVPEPVASGYAAVGKVEAQEKKARILTDAGTVATVHYVGNAPLRGSVYRYVSFSDGTYRFTLPATNHGNGGNQQDTAGWTFFGYKGSSESYLADSVPWKYYLSDETPVFIRFGNDRWRVLKDARAVRADSAPTIIYGYVEVGEARSQTEYNAKMVVVGNCDPNTKALISPGTDQTRFFDPEGKGWADGNVDIGEFYDVEIPSVKATGYAAVGKADTKLKKVRILTEDGVPKTVSFSGTAPVAGAVYQYVQYSNGIWQFSLPATNHGWGGNQADSGTAWTFGGYTGGAWSHTRNPADISYIADSNPWKYVFTETTPVFIRYDRYRWRVVTGTDAVKQDSTTVLYGYAVVGRQLSETEFVCNAFVLGNYSAEKKWIAPDLLQTKVFDPRGEGWPDGNVDLSALTDVPVPDPGVIVEEDVCAVGEVSGNRAVILKRSGKVAEVRFLGNPPQSGELATYSEYSGGYFVFAEAAVMPAPRTEPWIFMAVNDEKHPHSIFAGDARYRNTDKDTAFFVRYSATSWRLARGADAVIGNSVQFTGYINERLGYPINIVEYMLVGGYNAKKGKIVPATAQETQFLDPEGKGWSVGNIDLRFDSNNPRTGDNGPGGGIWVCLIFSSVCMAVFGKQTLAPKRKPSRSERFSQ